MGEHTHLLCRYLTTSVRLACWGRDVALALGNFNLAGRCSVKQAYNYVHAGRVRVALRMLRAKRAEAGNRGDALTVTMCQSAESFARRVGWDMMFEGGFGGGGGGPFQRRRHGRRWVWGWGHGCEGRVCAV